jgi:hypothetical protein
MKDPSPEPSPRGERVDHYTLAVDYPLFLRERTG